MEPSDLPDQSFVTYENGFKKTTTIKNGIQTTRLEPDYGNKGSQKPAADKPPFTALADVLAGTPVMQESLTGDSDPKGSQLTLLEAEVEEATRAALTDGPFGDQACCSMCGREVPWTECATGTEICLDCYDQAWEGFHCPNKRCKTDFGRSFSPWFVERDEEKGETIFECPSSKCKKHIVVHDDETDVQLEPLVKLSARCPAMSGDEFEQMLDDWLNGDDETDIVGFNHEAWDSVVSSD